MIESALRTHILGDTDITNLVGQRMYPVKLPQDPTMPAISYFRVSGIRHKSYGGPSGLAGPRIQIDAWAGEPSGYKTAKELADLIRKRLDGFSGLLGTDRIWGAFLENDTDMYEDETKLHRVSQDYFVWYKET